MPHIVVQGGTSLHGTVRVSGAKNAALPMMAAAILTDQPLRLSDVPDLLDVQTMNQLLSSLGVASSFFQNRLTLQMIDEGPCLADYELVRRMRASVCVLGPLLTKRRQATVSLPGGCNIGHRPIDLHLRGLAAMGAEIEVRSGYVFAQARQGLRGATVSMAGPQGTSVTGTFNIMAAATLARGTTVIEYAALEPEIVAVGEMLNAMGARIHGLGTSRITIEGVEALSGGQFTVIPDRIEAGTLLVAAAATKSAIQLANVEPSHLTAVLDLLGEMGATMTSLGDATQTLRFDGTNVSYPVSFDALPYPDIPTDLQAQLMSLLCCLPGESRIRDLVFPDRLMHVSELCRLGADIRLDGNAAIIQGTGSLSGANVMASDLRASAALVIAGLIARGETTIHRIYHLDRGYEQLENKLNTLGAQIERMDVARETILRRPA
ncbi:MAG: UDP-N-acetylglucosamine 1-carboxyvinyltransferase [Planctomycetaceae bacterium]|nr:UDP-N-acetylglucosamine 1-carboxyvinyltransferase [Planctomycetaceae bacterium]